MSSQNTPCRNPSVCGVQTHRPGTIAPCMTASAPGVSATASRLYQPVQTLSGQVAPPPSRQPTVHLREVPSVTPIQNPTLEDKLVGVANRIWNRLSRFTDRAIERQAYASPTIPSPEYAFGGPQEPQHHLDPDEVGIDFLESSLNDDRQDIEDYERKLIREERQAARTNRMEQAWDERRNAPKPDHNPDWAERYGKMEEAWEQRIQQRDAQAPRFPN